MAVVMRVGAALDERATQRVADRAERTFNDAGARAGRGFGQTFEQQVEQALTEKAFEKSARKIEAQLARAGKTGAEALNQAIANEASRTGLAADKIGETLQNRLGVHGQSAGQHFASMFMGELGNVAPGVSSALSGVAGAGRTAMEAVGGGAVAATAGVLGIGAAAVEVTKHLYDIGQGFDNVSKRIEIQTGKMGSDLQGITESVDQVAVRTASSLESIGAVAGSVSQAFHTTGEPLEALTKQISDLDRMTGENLNVRDFGKVARQWGLDADAARLALDDLKVASEQSGAPIGELVDDLNALGPAARSLGMDFGQTANFIDMFDQAGLDAASTTRGMNKMITEATKHHVDFKTVLGQAITEIHDFLAAGDSEDAQKLAQNLFGAKGAQQFIDAIRNGKLNVDDLNKSLDTTANAGHIEKLNDDTLRWADTWQIVKNRIEDALSPLAKPVFDTIQRGLRDFADLLPGGDHKPEAPPPLSPPPPGVYAPPPKQTVLPPGVGPQPQQPTDLGGLLGGGPDVGAPVPPGATLTPGAPAPPGALGPGPHPLSDTMGQDPDKAKKPAIPYGAGYGEGPQPGESEQHWKDRMGVLEKQHDLAEKRAELDDLEKNHADQQDDIVRKRNEVLHAQMDADEAQRTLDASVTKAQVPFGPGYGAAPRPGESSQQYGAEQSLIEADQKRRQAAAQLQQLESNAAVSDQDKVKARNDLQKAEQDEYQAQLRLQEASRNTTKQLDQLGAQIDADFGIGKGIPGIVDNLVRTLANVAAAPMLGQLEAIKQANEQATGIQGGYGLMGIMGAQNLAAGRSPILGRPLDTNTTTTNQLPSYGPSSSGGGYAGDAALLSNVPAGHYDASGDLSKGLGDCSSAVEDLVNIMDGAPTAGRGMSTGNAAQWLPAHGFVPTNVPMPGTFQVGFNPEHMQATLPGGTPFNWGSDAAAANRGIGGTGAWDPAFTQHYYRPAGAGYGAGGTGLSGGAFAGSGSGVVSVFVTNMPGGGITGLPGGAAAPGGAGAGASPGGAAPDAPSAPSAPGGGGPGDITNPALTPPGLTSFGNAPPGSTPGGAPAAPPAFGGPTLGGPMAPTDPMAPKDVPSGYGPDQNTRTPGVVPATQHGAAGGQPPGPGQGGRTKIGGVAPAANPQGGQAGMTPGGSLDTALGVAAMGLDVIAPGAGQAAEVGIKLANRAIQYGSQVAGIAAGGLMETFLPTGGSELAQNSWITKIAGGIAGARPQVPNLAGGPGGDQAKDKKGQGEKPSGGDINQNVTINQASAQPANDAAHILGVQARTQHQSAPAMGR